MPIAQRALGGFESGHGRFRQTIEFGIGFDGVAHALDQQAQSVAVMGRIAQGLAEFLPLLVEAFFDAFAQAREQTLALGGASVRHIMNVRFGWPRWKPALAGAIAGTLAALYLVGAPRASGAAEVEGGRPVEFAEANAVIQKRCAACHSASPADLTFGVAPAGVMFDTPEQIRASVERIRARAVETQTMPPANKTHITDEERALLGRWIGQGARVD